MLHYRKAEPDDAKSLAAVRMLMLEEIKGAQPEEQRRLVERANFDFFRVEMPEGRFVAFLCEDNGDIVGTSGMTFQLVPPTLEIPDGKTAYIMNIFTRPDYRGRGIAHELLDRTVKEAARLGFRKVTLLATDMGKPLYTKYGFQDVPGYMAYYHVK